MLLLSRILPIEVSFFDSLGVNDGSMGIKYIKINIRDFLGFFTD